MSKPIIELFTAHPRSVGEGYVQHFRVAAGCGVRMIVTGFCCIVHALLPFLFPKTGSNMINDYYRRFIKRGGMDDSPHT